LLKLKTTEPKISEFYVKIIFIVILFILHKKLNKIITTDIIIKCKFFLILYNSIMTYKYKNVDIKDLVYGGNTDSTNEGYTSFPGTQITNGAGSSERPNNLGFMYKETDYSNNRVAYFIGVYSTTLRITNADISFNHFTTVAGYMIGGSGSGGNGGGGRSYKTVTHGGGGGSGGGGTTTAFNYNYSEAILYSNNFEINVTIGAGGIASSTKNNYFDANYGTDTYDNEKMAAYGNDGGDTSVSILYNALDGRSFIDTIVSPGGKHGDGGIRGCNADGAEGYYLQGLCGDGGLTGYQYSIVKSQGTDVRFNTANYNFTSKTGSSGTGSTNRKTTGYGTGGAIDRYNNYNYLIDNTAGGGGNGGIGSIDWGGLGNNGRSGFCRLYFLRE
jgi:hypothetical protein